MSSAGADDEKKGSLKDHLTALVDRVLPQSMGGGSRRDSTGPEPLSSSAAAAATTAANAGRVVAAATAGGGADTPLRHVSSDVDLRQLGDPARLPILTEPGEWGRPRQAGDSQAAVHSRILSNLHLKAEQLSLAHRACIDPLLAVHAEPTEHASAAASAAPSITVTPAHASADSTELPSITATPSLSTSPSSSSSSRPIVRKTGIICTIGPNTNTPSALAELRRAGMNIMRMNFSHGSHEYHKSAIDNLRRSFDLLPGPPVAVALDTKGPEIRTGSMRAGEVELRAGHRVTVTVDVSKKDECDASLIYMDYANLPRVVSVGSLVYVDDGLISLRVESIDANMLNVQCTVVNTGLLNSKKGVNLPGMKVDLPSISEQDAKDLAFGVEQKVDIVFASFIRKREDIVNIRALLGDKGRRILIIAKIENQEGVNNFNDILTECDGVMVARGDLGIEIPVQKVFLAQKMMIARCNIVGKPVICATQMLESMTTNPRPTRAEVTDVGNAVIDGADCVMLSGETAKGKFPCECVRMMHVICIEAERSLHHRNFFHEVHLLSMNKHTNETLAAAAVNASFEQDTQALIVLSISGATARLVAKYRPACPIIAVTHDIVTSRQLHLTRGVYPVLCELPFDPKTTSWATYIDSIIAYAITEAQRKGNRLLHQGDIAIVVQGWTAQSGHTNTLRVIRI